MNTLGLIAGMGELPRAIASEAKARGFRVFAVGLEPLADNTLPSYVDEIKWVNVGRLGEIISSLKEAGVENAVMAGKVPKSLLYKSRILPDLRAVKLLFSLKNRSDDAILLALTKELEKEGIRLADITAFCSDILMPEGVLTENKITKDEWEDIRFGWKMAKEMGRLDIGQTVVVKGLQSYCKNAKPPCLCL